MPEHIVNFDVPSDRTTMKFSKQLLLEGGHYQVQIQDGDVYISGNANGLLYLAEAMVRCAKGGFVESFHLHLPLVSTADDFSTDPRDELVIFAASAAVL